jgi:hypothetical protein
MENNRKRNELAIDIPVIKNPDGSMTSNDLAHTVITMKDAVVKKFGGETILEGKISVTDLLDKIKPEEGTEELRTLESMIPYHEVIAATMQAQVEGTVESKRDYDLKCHHMRENIPLEQRYIYRMASALKYAFGDFDTMCLDIDHMTLSKEDWEKALAMFNLREIQMALMMLHLFGQNDFNRKWNKASSITNATMESEDIKRTLDFLNRK